jgi:hypothetical protein
VFAYGRLICRIPLGAIITSGVTVSYNPLAGNNTEEGNYIQKNNKTYIVRCTRQTYWKFQAQKGELDSLDE